MFSRFVRHYLLAIQFFTRIPVIGRLADWVGFSPAMLRASAAHFPGVGWIVGGLCGAMMYGLLNILPALPAAPGIAAILSTVFGALLTGAFHEDGLADTADGLGGAIDRERALEIMKDSRVGTYGALALVLVVLSKVALLALLGQANPTLAAWAVFAAHVTSRTMPLVLIRTLRHVGNDFSGNTPSKSKPLADNISTGGLGVGMLWCALALALTAWKIPSPTLLYGFVGALAGLAWMARLLHRRLQGFTGDGLGATQQISEVLFYLAVALSLPPAIN
jgi:adenosylcobinamide-GDP ribazoletransferase